jgi:Ca2+-binding RTX toxin-like protein
MNSIANRNRWAPLALTATALVTGLLALGIRANDAQAAGITAQIADGTLTITGDGAANKLALRLAPTAPGTLQLDIGDDGSADRSFDRATFTRIVVNAGGGDDEVRIREANDAEQFTNQETTTLNGQGGKDQLIGARNGETLSGGAGNDSLLNEGAGDVFLGGDGADTFIGRVGAGHNSIDGGAGNDRVRMTGSSSLGETIEIEPLAATGHVGVDDNAGTKHDLVALETLEVLTFDGNDRLDVRPGINLNLDIDAGDGNDLIFAGDGDDTLAGGNGNDAIGGGSGDDVLTGGPQSDIVAGNLGDDELVWNDGDGNDKIEGDGGSDLLDVNGGAAAERFDVSASGGRLRVFRDVASVALDAGAVERLSIESFGGRDVVTAPAAVPGLAAVELTLEAANDGQVDAVSLIGSGAPESFKVAPVAPLHVRVSSGAGRTVFDVIRSTELGINAGDGDDQLTSTLSRAAFFTVLTMRGQDGNDTLTGGAADEAMFGGAGNDTLRGGAGIDALFGEDGNDSLFGGADTDLLSGGPGIDRLDGGTSADQISCGGPGDTVIPGPADTINPDCT